MFSLGERKLPGSHKVHLLDFSKWQFHAHFYKNLCTSAQSDEITASQRAKDGTVSSYWIQGHWGRDMSWWDGSDILSVHVWFISGWRTATLRFKWITSSRSAKLMWFLPLKGPDNIISHSVFDDGDVTCAQGLLGPRFCKWREAGRQVS